MSKFKVHAKYKRPAKIHAIAMCLICNWEEGDMNTAVQDARNHVAKTGHTVHYEVGAYNKLYTSVEVNDEKY